MWRISALDRDGREVGRSELVAGELTIGRDSDRQLILPSASVSRRHAKLYVEGGQPCIIDEGSAIDVAEFHLSIESLDAGDGMAPPRPPARPTPVPGTMPSSLPPMRLVAEGGPYDGRVFELTASEFAVGRAVDNDVVLDDPSLSRKHAKIFRRGASELEIEDLGSSNGTFINQRKIGRGAVHPGDTVRFGELGFRVEGDTFHGTSAVSAEFPRNQFFMLAGGAAATLILMILMLVFLVRKPTPVQAPGKDSITRISRQADAHLRQGRTLIAERKYLEARIELDQALELDPANPEARRLRNLAVRAPEDEKTAAQAIARLGIGDRKGLEDAMRLLDDTTDGAPAHTRVRDKLTSALVSFGNSQCTQRAWSDCAWALCRAWELAPPEAKPEAGTARTLRDAERKIHERSYVRCRAAP